MKTILLVFSALALAACSRSDNAVTASPTPNPNLQRDAARLQEATQNAAKARESAAAAQASATPTATP